MTTKTLETLQKVDTPAVRDSSDGDLFGQAVQEDSNLEMDWLWLATKVRSNAQQRYALERALRINPRSAMAKRGLAQLSREVSMAGKTPAHTGSDQEQRHLHILKTMMGGHGA